MVGRGACVIGMSPSEREMVRVRRDGFPLADWRCSVGPGRVGEWSSCMSSTSVIGSGVCTPEVPFPLGVGEVDWVGDSSKSRDDASSGDDAMEWVIVASVRGGGTIGKPVCSESAAAVGEVWVDGGPDASISSGSGGVSLPLSMALTWCFVSVLFWRRWHVLTELFILVFPRFYGCGSRAAGDCNSSGG